MSQDFNKDNFQIEVVEASKAKPVLVDFFASWCGPCQIQGPIVDEIAEEIGDKAIVGKINSEEAMDLATQYGVMSLPTILIFRNGEAVKTMNGLQWKEGLIEEINKYL